jgi:hypothetical protein
MANTLKNQPATPESVWAILHEVAQLQKETRFQMQETDRKMQETDRKMQETSLQMKETDRKMQETDRQMKETDRKMQELQKTVGGISNNQGAFAEEYFFNSFENGNKNFFGEKFNEISKHLKNRWQGLEDEYDIVLYNHASVAIIEVKYKAHLNDIPVVLKKAETFRILFPHYKDSKIYLALASMSFFPELEQQCIEQGIAVVKQVGDTVVINESNLKTF